MAASYCSFRAGWTHKDRLGTKEDVKGYGFQLDTY